MEGKLNLTHTGQESVKIKRIGTERQSLHNERKVNKHGQRTDFTQETLRRGQAGQERELNSSNKKARTRNKDKIE